ncbi:MAG: trans-2-enoyl-CoA reductase family protein [Spirochaetaceae bacterium]|nr:MAG: trans-2-enoyl-CoA reductase family protein [Spirochaetaceae bacterium]
MILQPMIRNNICMNAHPVGCAVHVREQIEYVRGREKIEMPKRVLVIGSSAGYGLASRITAAFAGGAGTIGVAYEKPASGKRPATVGWYNTEVFEKAARENGLVAESVIGDAFSDEVKQEVIEKIKALLGQVDLVVYSLASGVRTDPKTGETYRSALKPIGGEYTAKSIDPMSGVVADVTIQPATDEETESTVKVMGGEDWELWVEALLGAGVLADGAITVAYSYIGPEVTRAVYRDGTIGKAKEHLEKSAAGIDRRLTDIGGHAYVSVNKALVTRSSAVIPVVPLYLASLFRVMKEKGLHEGCIEQMYRLFSERLYAGGEVPVDGDGRIRLDDWEMRDDVQQAVAALWDRVTTENVGELIDIESYKTEFLNIHGFGYDSVDYDADVEV